MFSWIICEYPLPEADEEIQHDDFQTKDLDNDLDLYTITKEGRLIHHTVKYENVPEKERPYFKDPDFQTNGLKKLFGSMKSVPDKDIDTNFHGVIRFYTSKILSYKEEPKIIGNVQVGQPDKMEWYEYSAKFTDGTLTEIHRMNEEEIKERRGW